MSKEFYAKVTRDERGKKVVKLGKKWGDMGKKEANTSCVATGDGLWVLDIDTKKYAELPKKLIKLLPKPTVETANGFHYYFKGDGIAQTQKLFDKVDVRNEGGLVFNKYWGKDETISYKKTGDISTPSKELMQYLNDAQSSHTKRDIKTLNLSYKEGTPWKQFKDGEQHTMLMATMVKMFNDHKTDDEVWSRAEEYQNKYLDNTPHEARLMQGRFKWAKKQIGDNKIKGTPLKVDKPKKKQKKVKNDSIKKFLLRNGEFDKDDAKKVQEIKIMQKFIPKHHHTVVYGASGTMKTSIITKELIAELKRDKKLNVYLFSFDASNLHNRAMWRYAIDEGVTDRFHVLHEANKTELFDFITQATKKGYNLDDTVIVIDTYKKIAGNVNDKGVNTEIMGEIKKIVQLGCTVVTIAHSNKDGLTNSGTAELEQDTDGLLRFDAHHDSVTGSTVSVTLGGRLRFPFEPCSFKTGDCDSYDDVMTSLYNVPFVDVSMLNDKENKASKYAEREIRDLEKIEAVGSAIEDGHHEMLPIQEVTGLSKMVVRRILRTYDGVHWVANGMNDAGGTIYKKVEEHG